MEVGYLPDMFGHVAQMPQILSLAGFEHAVVWRGVPSAVDRTAFRWHAPDGSSVRAEYLVAGYGNGAALPEDAKALVRRLRSLDEEFDPFLAPDDPLLLMNGTDHQRPQPWLGRVVAEANQIQSEFELDHLVAARLPGRRARRRSARLARRAALGSALEPADGSGVQPGRRQAGGSPGRAGARADGRASVRPVPAGRRAGRSRSCRWPGCR